MKRCIAVLLFLSALSSAQAQDSIQLKRTSWAGGVCCSKGEQFYLSIPKSLSRKKIDSLWVSIPGYRIHVSSALFLKGKKVSSASFGWETHSEDEQSNSADQWSYKGIVVSDVLRITDLKSASKVTMFLKNGKTKEVPISYRTEFLAYP